MIDDPLFHHLVELCETRYPAQAYGKDNSLINRGKFLDGLAHDGFDQLGSRRGRRDFPAPHCIWNDEYGSQEQGGAYSSKRNVHEKSGLENIQFTYLTIMMTEYRKSDGQGKLFGLAGKRPEHQLPILETFFSQDTETKCGAE